MRRLRRPRTLWAELLSRVYGHDVLRCPCGGRRRVLTFLSDPAVIAKTLAHVGLAGADTDVRARPPPTEAAVGASDGSLRSPPASRAPCSLLSGAAPRFRGLRSSSSPQRPLDALDASGHD